jgi:hypothetical protein
MTDTCRLGSLKGSVFRTHDPFSELKVRIQNLPESIPENELPEFATHTKLISRPLPILPS